MYDESTNICNLRGHVGNVSEMRDVAGLRVATLVMYTNSINNGKRQNTRHEIEVWRGVADRARNCVVGAHINIRGRIDSRETIDAHGQRIFKTVIVGTWIDVLDNRSSNQRKYDINQGANAAIPLEPVSA